MNWERALLIVTAIAASIAAGASTLQGYVSWNGRNDVIRSIALSQLETRCGDFVRDAYGFETDPRITNYNSLLADLEFLIMTFISVNPDTSMVLDKQVIVLRDSARQLPKPSQPSDLIPAIENTIHTVEVECVNSVLENTGRPRIENHAR
jgi:hypothetical protein